MSTPLPSSQIPGDLCLRDPEADTRRKKGLNLFRAALGAGIAMGGGIIVLALFFWTTSAGEPVVYPIGVGIYLLLLSVGGLVWFSRLPGRTIVSLRPTDDGIQVRLRNDTTLSVDWSSTKLAFDLSKGHLSTRNPAAWYGFAWRMDRATVGCRLTEAGWTQLMTAARVHGLRVTEKVVGKGPYAQTIFNVRAGGARN